MQRKVFRIEQMLTRSAPPRGAPPARQAQELSALLGDGRNRRMARAAGELGAMAEAMEKSTHTILKSAEVIGGQADRLAAVSREGNARAAARDIQSQLIRIFEACNFQDLAGQRIGKVIDTLCRIDGELSRMMQNGGDQGCAQIERSSAAKDVLLNGPRLDGEDGHVSQHDVDALFD